MEVPKALTLLQQQNRFVSGIYLLYKVMIRYFNYHKEDLPTLRFAHFHVYLFRYVTCCGDSQIFSWAKRHIFRERDRDPYQI